MGNAGRAVIEDMGQVIYAPYLELAQEDIEAGLELLARDLSRCAGELEEHIPRRTTVRILAIYAEAGGQYDLAARIRAHGGR